MQKCAEHKSLEIKNNSPWGLLAFLEARFNTEVILTYLPSGVKAVKFAPCPLWLIKERKEATAQRSCDEVLRQFDILSK